jgi:hypothetical protein
VTSEADQRLNTFSDVNVNLAGDAAQARPVPHSALWLPQVSPNSLQCIKFAFAQAGAPLAVLACALRLSAKRPAPIGRAFMGLCAVGLSRS